MTATEERPVQILELFGGIGSPRCALRNLKIPTKAIDYVEIDEKAVRSYNNMFSEELLYKTQSVVGWNLKPDILIHGFVRYQKEMERMGYTNNYDVLDAREFGLPQARERVFTISCLNGEKFDFTSLIRTPMRKISEFLEDNENVPEVYNVTQPSVYNVIGASGIKRATVIKDFAYTITTRQDRTPAQVIDCGSGRYRYLTERECWRLMGYTDEEFEAAKAVHERKGRYYMTLYKQAGNSIAVPIFESIFRKIILGEEKTKKDDSERQKGDAGR